MITATILKTQKDSNGIRVFVSFSDGFEASYLFDRDANEEQIRTLVKGIIREKEFLEEKALELDTQLVGKTITLN